MGWGKEGGRVEREGREEGRERKREGREGGRVCIAGHGDLHELLSLPLIFLSSNSF